MIGMVLILTVVGLTEIKPIIDAYLICLIMSVNSVGWHLLNGLKV